MRINVHAHVFNLKNVLTKEAIDIFLGRLTNQKLPKYLTTPLRSFLKTALDGGIDEDTTENRALALILKKIAGHTDFKKLVGAADAKRFAEDIQKELDGLLPVAEPGQGILFLKGIFATLVRAHSEDADKDAAEKTVLDFLEFLRINFLPSIDAVTDELIAQSGPEDLFVTLPMDIIHKGASSNSRDFKVYPKQFDATVRQCLRYPGRILPFAKVNPLRGNNTFDLLKKHSADGKCIGVKLYPSLGYDVDTPEMRKAYKICSDRDLPVLLHCNDGGFRKSQTHGQRCHPSHWTSILQDFPKLKVCFGHFGGGENLVDTTLDPTSWTQTILDLMQAHPDQVFADISYHTHCMENATVKANYRKHLKALLKDPVYGSQILWGSDFHLVRQQLSDRSYINFFSRMFTATEFRKLSVTNPQRFLGMGSQPGSNLQRHVAFLDSHREDLTNERPSPKWLHDYAWNNALPLSGYLVADDWELNNRIHSRLVRFLFSNDYKEAKLPRYLPASLKKKLEDDYPSSADRFEAAGNLRMGQLAFHPGSPDSGIQTDQDSDDFATDLLHIFVASNWYKAKPKSPGTSTSEVRNEIRKVARNRGALVKQLGRVLNEHYFIST